jgi:hypothetical protein
MKAPLAFALFAVAALLILNVPAQAKPSPVEPQRVIAISVDDTAIATGPAGALLEANYFNAAPPAAYSPRNSCRMQFSMFDKTRLARVCN